MIALMVQTRDGVMWTMTRMQLKYVIYCNMYYRVDWNQIKYHKWSYWHSMMPSIFKIGNSSQPNYLHRIVKIQMVVRSKGHSMYHINSQTIKWYKNYGMMARPSWSWNCSGFNNVSKILWWKLMISHQRELWP